MGAPSVFSRVVSLSRTAGAVVRRHWPTPPERPSPGPRRPRPEPARPGPARAERDLPAQGAGYPGDFTGRVQAVYRPDLDGAPDPGEVVWTWVPYEDDPSRGKDRPVLLVGHDGPWLLGLMLSSRDHDAQPDGRSGQWVDVGSGAWDSQGRASEARVDRVVRVDPEAVRREGAVLDRRVFDLVTRSLR